VKLLKRVVVGNESMQSIVNDNTLMNFFQKKPSPIKKNGTSLFHSWLTPLNPDLIQRSRTLVVVGTYLIGKEKVFLAIAEAIKSKIYAETSRRKVYACQDNPLLGSLITNDPLAANVHAVPMMRLNKEVC
jgi:hypothetical protein